MRRAAVAVLAGGSLALASFAACDDGAVHTLGLSEPLRVHDAQFIPGPLPGAAPDAGAGTGPQITNVTLTNPTVLPGQAGKAINGRAKDSASAVGLRFADMGSGYWVVPMGPADNQFPGELTWQAITDVSPLVASAPGFHEVRAVAFDAQGNAGTQNDFTLCIEPAIPDNGATCNPSRTPPAALVSLTWDPGVDIDLVLVGPGGKVVDAKHPTTLGPDAGLADGGPDPTGGRLDRDSLAGCVEDGRRREDVVWQQPPASGTTYDVYANLFDACGEVSASYVATVYAAQDGRLTAVQSAKGGFTRYDANGGAALGTYLFSYSFP